MCSALVKSKRQIVEELTAKWKTENGGGEPPSSVMMDMFDQADTLHAAQAQPAAVAPASGSKKTKTGRNVPMGSIEDMVQKGKEVMRMMHKNGAWDKDTHGRVSAACQEYLNRPLKQEMQDAATTPKTDSPDDPDYADGLYDPTSLLWSKTQKYIATILPEAAGDSHRKLPRGGFFNVSRNLLKNTPMSMVYAVQGILVSDVACRCSDCLLS